MGSVETKTRITEYQVIEPLKKKMDELVRAHEEALKIIESRKDSLGDIAVDWINGIKMNIDILNNTLDRDL